VRCDLRSRAVAAPSHRRLSYGAHPSAMASSSYSVRRWNNATAEAISRARVVQSYWPVDRLSAT
jgi:hypothetical protein